MCDRWKLYFELAKFALLKMIAFLIAFGEFSTLAMSVIFEAADSRLNTLRWKKADVTTILSSCYFIFNIQQSRKIIRKQLNEITVK
jgi:hypothetical protein